MSRATLVLAIVAVLVVALLVFLSRTPSAVAPHRIEKVVTLPDANGGGGGAKGDDAK